MTVPQFAKTVVATAVIGLVVLGMFVGWMLFYFLT